MTISVVSVRVSTTKTAWRLTTKRHGDGSPGPFGHGGSRLGRVNFWVRLLTLGRTLYEWECHRMDALYDTKNVNWLIPYAERAPIISIAEY